jgi:hypothetical protein
MDMLVVTVCWAATSVLAFVTGRLFGYLDRQEHIDFLRSRVGKLSDRVDRLEGGEKCPSSN